MVANSSAFHRSARNFAANVAASPASFQPSNAATTTGSRRDGVAVRRRCGIRGVYPAALASKSSEQELMQYRSPVGPGPSGNTCPRWPPQLAHMTSMRRIPCETSSSVLTFSATAGEVKLGQPVPESNLVSDENRAAPQAAQWYMPSSWLCTYLPVKGGSVP